MTMADDSRSAKLFGPIQVPLALGLLRLSIQDRPSLDDSIRLIHQALDLGIRILDTADSYCLDNKDFHYGESLAKLAVESWQGPRDEVRIITKVGLVRPNGKWVPKGTAKHIAKSIDQSLESLGTERIFLLQLHVKDSRVPFDETLGTLAKLRDQGKIEHVGLCNVGPAEVRQALRHFPVACIQCELSLLSRKSATDGMLLMSEQLGIPFLAYRPLGGHAKVEKLASNRVLASIAQRQQATPFEIALAAVLASSKNVIPLFGATQLPSLLSSVRATQIVLGSNDRAELQSKYSFDADPDAAASVLPQAVPSTLPSLQPNTGPGIVPEIVMLMGIQGAGKSELVRSYVEHGYARLNRDQLGGKVDDLVDQLQELLTTGHKRVVLDNTYPTRISRAGVVRVAHAFGVPVRCRLLETSIDEARTNIITRILDRYERLLGPSEMKELSKVDSNLPPPVAMQRWLDTLERPDWDEGFSAIDSIPFVRRVDTDYKQRALLLDVDGTLRSTRSGELYPRTAEDVVLLPERRERLQPWVEKGFLLFLVSNQSGIASGKLKQSDADAAFQRTVELLGLPVTEIVYCPHPAFPVGCFCRKPMPGLAVYLQRKYKLDLSQSIMIGDMESDAAFARSINLRYIDANEFFQ
jgi:histidinol-phosphate phosphatase family protein